MSIKLSQDHIDEINEIWQWIRWWKKKFGFTIEELARRAKYPKDKIERGLNGEPESIRHALPNFVVAFGLDLKARELKLEGGIPSYDEYKKLLKPPRELTPSEKLSNLEKF